jgi:hypothetical protein
MIELFLTASIDNAAGLAGRRFNLSTISAIA